MKIADFDFETLDTPTPGMDGTPDVPPSATTGSIIDRFASIAASYPHRIATRDETGEISYAGLDRQSNRIAHFIAGLNLPVGSLVGVMTGRNRHYIAATLGVLKAGETLLLDSSPHHGAEAPGSWHLRQLIVRPIGP